MGKIYKTLLFTLLIVVLVACGGENDTANPGEGTEDVVTIEHEYGKPEVKKNPKNVVVFEFGILDTLDELGIEVAGVPQATIPNYLEKYADSTYTNVGSLKEPDFEAIHALNPEVIFISGRQAELYDEFAKIAPTVYIGMDYSHYMESFEKAMRIVGQIFDKEREMDEQLASIQSSIDELKEKAETEDRSTLVVMGNEGKVSAYGPASRFGVIHDVFGFKAADENIEESTHGQNITFEYILEKNPDVLFVIDRDAAFAEDASVREYVENELVMKTKAYENDKIIYLDAGYWYLSGGGLQSMKKMIESLEVAL